MRDRIDDLTGRVQGVEGKIDQLSGQVNQRFDGIEVGLVEQRQYTEFAYSLLDAKMDDGFARLDAKMDAGFARLDRKLDQFIDVQLHANALVDRRLSALESSSSSDAKS